VSKKGVVTAFNLKREKERKKEVGDSRCEIYLAFCLNGDMSLGFNRCGVSPRVLQGELKSK
jgi:hypothetical protein